MAARAVRAATQRPGWPRWALLVAGLAIGVGLVVALRWPDGAGAPAGPTTTPAAASLPFHDRTVPYRDVGAVPARGTSGAGQPDPGGQRRPQGTADKEAEDLLHQAEELAKALQERQKEGKGEDAQKKLAELERKVDELIGKGRIRSPATTQIRQAVAELAQAAQQPG